MLGACGTGNFGYMPEGGVIKPCILIKFDNILDLDFRPVDSRNIDQYYDDDDYPTPTKLMTSGLKTIIESGEYPDSIFFDCFGQYAADKEAVQMEYFPKKQAFSLKYFPFKGGNYHSPLVAVQLTVEPGQVVQIECRAYYKGVKHEDGLGLVRFSILIEKE